MRFAFLDRWKGILILLVVLGHAVGAAGHLASISDRAFYGWCYKFIYAFHMQAFFFAAGLTFRAPDTWRVFAQRRLVRLWIPYFIFGLVTAALYMTFGGSAVPHDSHYAGRTVSSWTQILCELLYGGAFRSGQTPFVYNSVLWFIPTLLSLQCMARLIDSIRSSEWGIRGQIRFLAVLALLFLFVSFPIRTCSVHLPWGLSCVPYYLFFFTLGRLARPDVLVRIFAPYRRYAAIGSLFAWGALAAITFHLPDLSVQFASLSWHLAFAAVALLGILASGLTALSLPDSDSVSPPSCDGQSAICACVDPVSRFLSLCGIASLAIMLMHKPAVFVLQFVCRPIRSLFTHHLLVGSLGCLFVTFVAILSCLFVRRILLCLAPWSIGEKRTF